MRHTQPAAREPSVQWPIGTALDPGSNGAISSAGYFPMWKFNFTLMLTLLCPVSLRAQSKAYAAVDSAVQSGIARGIYPGAVLLIGRRDSLLYAKGYGHLTWNRASPTTRPDSTLWDLASLSKVVATTSAVMLLVERGRVSLDQPVARYLPRFVGGRKSEVTVRMLLDHTSGLRSYVEFYKLAPTRDSAVALLYAEPLIRAPGAEAEYSDLNAILLGLLVEAVTGEPLDRFVEREVFVPLRMTQTTYRPPPSTLRRTAPTGVWRGHPSAGVVNDRNAVRLGGAAGHAGVFSTGTDLVKFAQMWLAHGALPAGRFVQAVTIRTFLQHDPGSGTRLLGWDSPDTSTVEPTAYG
ncbi:MAG: serine hydrolase domain-containing protein, partial [Gemmatimonadota bacterium]